MSGRRGQSVGGIFGFNPIIVQALGYGKQIHNVLNSYGLKWKKETLTTEKGLKSIMAFDWEPIVRIELDV